MAAFPELLVSLTIQCTVLLLITHFLVLRTRTSIAADQLWSCCHLLILLLSLAGVLLPHVRLFRSELLLNLCHMATAFPVIQSFWSIVFWIWFSVALGMTANMLRSLVQISLMLRTTSQIPLYSEAERSSEDFPEDSDVASSHTILADEVRGFSVRIVTSDSCALPFCWQLHRPVIVMPESVSEIPDDELRAVIRHELAHLRSRHPMMLFLQRLVEIGFWFHPLVWRASRAAAKQRELSADRNANNSRADAVSFLRCLMRLSASSLHRFPDFPIRLNLFSNDESTVRHRVDQLLAIDWTLPQRSEAASRNSEILKGAGLLVLTGLMATAIWIPLNPQATGRTLFSPWPASTATLLHEVGISVRDYELDSHRVTERFHADD